MNPELDRYYQVFHHVNPASTADEWAFFQAGITRHTLPPRALFIEAGERNHQLGFVVDGLIAEAILIEQQRRIESFQFDSAEQRYLTFVQEHPTLFNRISLTHLASYLGIERPSLSRIRRKVAGL